MPCCFCMLPQAPSEAQLDDAAAPPHTAAVARDTLGTGCCWTGGKQNIEDKFHVYIKNTPACSVYLQFL